MNRKSFKIRFCLFLFLQKLKLKLGSDQRLIHAADAHFVKDQRERSFEATCNITTVPPSQPETPPQSAAETHTHTHWTLLAVPAVPGLVKDSRTLTCGTGSSQVNQVGILPGACFLGLLLWRLHGNGTAAAPLRFRVPASGCAARVRGSRWRPAGRASSPPRRCPRTTPWTTCGCPAWARCAT